MEAIQIDWLAVLVAAVAHFVLGGVWYSPLLFAKPFVGALGKTEDELREGGGPSAALYASAFAGGLVKSAALAILIGWIGGLGVGEAALLGAFVGLLIHGVADVVNALFEGRSRTLVAIGVGYDTVGLAIAGAIIAALS